MKTKQPKWWMPVLSFALLTFAASCATQSDFVQEQEEENNIESKNYISLNITAPGDSYINFEGAATRGTSLVPTGDENRVKKLKLYIYAYDGTQPNNFNSKYEYVLQREVSWKADAVSSIETIDIEGKDENGNDYSLEKKYIAIIALANHEGNIHKEGNTIYEDLKSMVIRSIAKNEEAGDNTEDTDIVTASDDWWKVIEGQKTLSMYYCSFSDNEIEDRYIYVTKTKGAKIIAKLKRHVARLDIANLTPGLTVNNVYLKNVATDVYPIPEDLFSGAYKVDKFSTMKGYRLNCTFGLGDWEMPEDTEIDIENNLADYMKTYFYMAPYKDPDTEVNEYGHSTAVIEYTIQLSGGEERNGVLEVPFVDAEYKSLEIKPNNRYIIKLGDGTKISNGYAKPDAKIMVYDWDIDYDSRIEDFFNINKDEKIEEQD